MSYCNVFGNIKRWRGVFIWIYYQDPKHKMKILFVYVFNIPCRPVLLTNVFRSNQINLFKSAKLNSKHFQSTNKNPISNLFDTYFIDWVLRKSHTANRNLYDMLRVIYCIHFIWFIVSFKRPSFQISSGKRKQWLGGTFRWLKSNRMDPFIFRCHDPGKFMVDGRV